MNKKESKKIKARVTITTNDAIHVFKATEIVFCKGGIFSSEIYLVNGNVVRVNVSLEEIENQLNEASFWRAGENYIINLNYLINIRGESDQAVLMVNQYSIPVQNHRRNMLLEALSKL